MMYFDNVFQDERYKKYIGLMAIVPMTYGRHVPIISDKVIICGSCLQAILAP